MDFEQAIQLILEKLNLWLTELIKMLPNLFLASVILVIGFYISKSIRRFVKKGFQKYFPTNTLAALGVNLIYIFCLGVVTFVTLKVLHLDKTITTMLAGAGVVGLALAFAFQDIASNFISGVFISFRRPFKVNDIVQIKEITGFVKEIRLRDTTILTFDGQYVTIPNKDVFQSAIINYSYYGKRRLELKGGVSQADDLRLVQKVALETMQKIEGIYPEESSLLFDGLGESTIDFTLRVWMKGSAQADYANIKSEIIIKLKESFDQNDIALPFPIRTLDFAMKGGKTLAQMLASKETEK